MPQPEPAWLPSLPSSPSVTEPVGQLPNVVQTQDYVIVVAQTGDTQRSLARRFLGDADQYWVIADFNDLEHLEHLEHGREVVIPLRSPNPLGVYAQGYQTVPVLSYHQFGHKKSKTSVSPGNFEAQMAYLRKHDYRVIPLTDLIAFLQGRTALPRRAVVITIDDGYKSAYTIAYPILRRYGFPATLFVYSNFIGKGGLSWAQMQEMVASGLIDVQPHSVSHANLGRQQAGENDTAYRQRIRREVRLSRQVLQDRLPVSVHTFCYPYGDTNDVVIEHLQEAHYQMGVTVLRGSNAFFDPPFMLQRSMIYGHHSLRDFAKNLIVFREMP